MVAAKRTAADWIWTVVGFLGVACILVALYLLLFRARGAGSPEAGERADRLRTAAREKLEEGDARGALRDLGAAETLAANHPDEFDEPWRKELATEISSAKRRYAEQRWAAGKERLEAGDAEGAVKDFQAAILANRGPHGLEVQPRYLNDLGEAFFAAGENVAARQAWLDAIGLSPIYATPYLNLARWHEAEGNTRAALSRYRAAVAFHPEPVPEELTEKLHDLLEEERDALAAESEKYRERFRANPADWDALNHLLWRRLWTIRVDPEGPTAAGIESAVLSVGRDFEDLDDLLARQEAAVSDRPGSVVDRAGLGTILLLGGEFERARDVFGEALDLSDTDRTSLLGAALADLLTGSEDGARLTKAAKSLQTNLLAWIALASHLVSRSDMERARSALINALRLDAGMPEVYRLLALALDTEDQRRNREAARKAYERISGS